MTHTTLDRLALAASMALMAIGVVVLGAVETLAGQPYGAAPMTNDAGEVIATPLVDPALRTGLVIAGIVVLGLWGLYRTTVPHPDEADDTPSAPATAD